MSSEDSPPDDSEEHNDRTDQDTGPETSSSNETSTDTTPGEDGEDDDSSEGSGYTPFRHPTASMYQDIYEAAKAARRSMIRPEDVKSVRKALIESDAISTLEMLSDPELQKQLAQPIDPQTVKKIQETAATIQQLSDIPRIHQDSEIIQTLQKLNDPAILDAYETAARLEQIQHPTADHQDDNAPAEQDVDTEPDASETEIAADPVEDTGQGSAFLSYTATSLLSYSDQLSEDATRYLEKIPDAEEAEKQKEYFRKAVPALDGKDVERLRLVLWQWVGIIMTFHYGSNVVDSSRDEDTSTDVKDGEEQ